MMSQSGYTSEEIERVRQIILKKNFQSNPEAQAIEDALCLVFLEQQLWRHQFDRSADSFSVFW